MKRKTQPLPTNIEDATPEYVKNHVAEWDAKIMAERVARIRDEDIDTSDIPEVRDLSKAVVGKFYRPIKDGTESCHVGADFDPLKPSVSLLSKLGSIAVHAEEFLSPKGHACDKAALDTALNDPEVHQWMAAMGEMALLPVKR